MNFLSAIKLFKNKDLGSLLVANIVSTMGDFLTSLALPIYLYSTKKDPLILAMSYFAFYLPKFPVQLFAGIYVDKGNPRQIFIYGNLLSFLFTLAYVFIVGFNNLTLLYINIFIISSINTFVGVSSSTMLSRMTTKEDYPLAISVFTMVYSICAIAIPPLGTLLLLKSGVKPMFLLDAVSFLSAGIIVLSVISAQLFPTLAAAKNKMEVSIKGIFTEIRQGYMFVLDKTVIKLSLTLLFFGGVVGRFVDVLMVFILQDKYRLGMELGNFMGIRGIGSLVGSFLILQFMGKDMFKSFITIHFLAVGSLLFFVLPANLWISGFGIFAFGFFTIGISLAVRNILNAHTKREDLGKIFSVFRVVVSLSSVLPLLFVDQVQRLLGSASNALLAAIVFCLIMDALFFVSSARYTQTAVEEI